MNFATAKVHAWRCGSIVPHDIFVVGSGGSLRMYASSAWLTRGCSSGERYEIHHRTSHRNPMAPVRMNAHSHPYEMVMIGTISGVSRAPMFVPALKIPVANARSLRGNHSATVLMAPGKLPASPRPSAKRAPMKPATDAL